MTERSVARHRALHKPGSPLSGLTGSLSLMGDYVGSSARRSGVIIAMSSGLVASMALPASALTAAPVEASGPRTASVPAVPSSAFFAAPEAGLLALPPDLVTSNVPVVASAAATVAFDHTDFTAVRSGSLVDRIDAGPAPSVTSQGGGSRPAASTGFTRPRSASTWSSPAPASPESETAPAASTSGSSVLAVASRYVGVPYRWGGTTPAGFDCSGFVQYVYGVLGRELPRTVAQQRAVVRIISRSQAQPGDLVIFGDTHIAIYAGGNMMYDAPHSGSSVGMREIYSANVSFGRV